jgi:hypothetical protein
MVKSPVPAKRMRPPNMVKDMAVMICTPAAHHREKEQ